MFVASMAFFAKVSDPAVGGTYMTLLNTLCNLGGNWPATAALWFVDPLTFRQCSTDYTNGCSTITEREVGCSTLASFQSYYMLYNGKITNVKIYLLFQVCANTNNGVCIMQLDGYYIESILCLIIGFSWLRWGRRKINILQAKPMSAWKIVLTRNNR